MADGSVPYGQGWVAYRDFGGPGRAVMLVHGLGGNLAHWGRVAPLIQERYRLVAIDLPSHGASSAPVAYSFDHDIGAVEAPWDGRSIAIGRYRSRRSGATRPQCARLPPSPCTSITAGPFPPKSRYATRPCL